MAQLTPRPTNLLRVDERYTRLVVLRAARQASPCKGGSKLPHSKMDCGADAFLRMGESGVRTARSQECPPKM